MAVRAAAPKPGRAARPPAGAELESFLINFVVEQTGYPAEVVELDADLEADLGIDSIKKAQLFGELREYFDVTPSEDLTLDDFPTLRHVLKFLQGESIKSSTAAAEPIAAQAVTQLVTPEVSVPVAELPTVPRTGTPYGVAFTRANQEKATIVRLLRRYADLPEQARAELSFPLGGGEEKWPREQPVRSDKDREGPGNQSGLLPRHRQMSRSKRGSARCRFVSPGRPQSHIRLRPQGRR